MGKEFVDTTAHNLLVEKLIKNLGSVMGGLGFGKFNYTKSVELWMGTRRADLVVEAWRGGRFIRKRTLILFEVKPVLYNVPETIEQIREYRRLLERECRRVVPVLVTPDMRYNLTFKTDNVKIVRMK